MKKRIAKCVLLVVFIAIVVFAIFNIYKWVVCGKQSIKISTPNKAFTNSDLYVSVIAQKDNVDLETKTKIKLVNSKGRKVRKAKGRAQARRARPPTGHLLPDTALVFRYISKMEVLYGCKSI